MKEPLKLSLEKNQAALTESVKNLLFAYQLWATKICDLFASYPASNAQSNISIIIVSSCWLKWEENILLSVFSAAVDFILERAKKYCLRLRWILFRVRFNPNDSTKRGVLQKVNFLTEF